MAVITRSTQPYILNPVPFGDTRELYSTPRSNEYLQTGLRVTVTVPPLLRAFRYPNMTSAGGTPYLGEWSENRIDERREWYKAAAKTSRTDEARNNVVRRFSSEFDISKFVTSLSWSSSADNGFVQVDMELDNIQGFFNYLPSASKVTIWRRKSLDNLNGIVGGKWYPYIVSYVMDKSRSGGSRDHKMSLTCQDRAGFLKANLSESTVFKNKTPRQITIEVCRKEGIPYDASKIPASINGVALPALERFEPADKDLVAVIGEAWLLSWAKLKKTQQLPYTIHMRTGVLEVEFIAPPGSSELSQKQIVGFTDDANIESGTLSEKLSDETFTELKATGNIRTKATNRAGNTVNSKRKVTRTFRPTDRPDAIIQAYGKKVKQHTFTQIFATEAEFIKTGQTEIDKISQPEYGFSFKSRGMLGLWPNRYISITSRYFGIRGNIPINRVSYTVSEGKIEVDIELILEQRFFTEGFKHLTKYPKLDPELRWY